MLTNSEKIKILIRRRDMTLRELAEKLGQSAQNLSNKIGRDNFKEIELRKIAEVLNCEYISSFRMRDTDETI